MPLPSFAAAAAAGGAAGSLQVTICLLLIWVIAYNFAYTNWRAYVDANWDTISDFLPAKYR